MKKLVSLLLIVVMMFSISVVAFASENEQEYLFEDKFVEEFVNIYSGELETYDYFEKYYHYDENNELDWVLVCAGTMGYLPWEIQVTVGDRVFWASSERCPFSFSYAIYDVDLDRFFDLRTELLDKYEGLYDVLSELNIGKLIGDVDNDGMLTIFDATFIQRVVAQMDEFDKKDVVAGYSLNNDTIYFISDYNRDGERDILDATAIQYRLIEGEKVGRDAIYSPYNVSTWNKGPALDIPYEVVYQGHHYADSHNVKNNYFAVLIKTSHQYAKYFNMDRNVYNDAFFENNYLLTVVTPKLDGEDAEDIVYLGLGDNTLLILTNPVADKEVEIPMQTRPYFTFLAVDKTYIDDVDDISWWHPISSVI